MSAFLAILSWLSVFLLVEGINRKSTPLIGSYLDELIYDRAAERKRKTFLERRVLPKARDLAVRYSFLESFSEPEKIAPLLDYAGRPYDLDTEQFMGYQIYLARIGFICGLVYFILALLTGFLCGGPIALILGADRLLLLSPLVDQPGSQSPAGKDQPDHARFYRPLGHYCERWGDQPRPSD